MCAADFRTACKKAGLALIVIFAARCVADAVTALIGALMADCDAQITSSVQALANILILYVLAIAVTSKLLGYRFDGSLYKKPKRLGKAVSWFVPMYGAGQAANIAVMAISFFYSTESLGGRGYAYSYSFFGNGKRCVVSCIFVHTDGSAGTGV